MNAHLYIISPSGAVLDKAGFRRGVKRLQELGFRVTVDASALDRTARFAGDDATRIAALARAAAAGADAVMLGRGGYGLSRILPALPVAAIQASIAQGCKWIGYSDFTALQLTLLSAAPSSQAAPVTWAGPFVAADIGRKEPDDITLDCFLDLMGGVAEGMGWRLAPRLADDVHKRLGPSGRIDHALLWGGNLCVLTSLMGTPYFPHRSLVDGGILFLEDVAEHPYRIERMLLQLLHAGVLQEQRAILMGQFSDYRLSSLDKGYNLAQVVAYLQSLLPHVPIISGLPFGHEATKVCLPVGARVSLSCHGRDALLVWGE